MKATIAFSLLLMISTVTFAQQTATPQDDYEELTDTKPHDGADIWAKIGASTQLSWGTTDIRYKKLNVPTVKKSNHISIKGWKGERLNAQALLWTNKDLKGVRLTVSDLHCGADKLPTSAISAHFVRYVMTDELNKDGNGGCGHREDKAKWDSSMVADVIDIAKMRDVKACSTQPLWLKIRIPADAKAGKYNGTLTVSGANMKPMRLGFEVEVLNRTLTNPRKWALHLDFWQNPYAVARYYKVPLWSKEHFDAMRPIMKMLADIGQRSVTTSIMYMPWNGQTEDPYNSMIARTKKIDGTWTYDYTVFDKWVTFMTEDIGIDELINCYTMIPWNLRFDYFDQATNRIQFVKAQPGEQAYTDYWFTFLKDFSRHLRQKGWFSRTAISMDERSMEHMKEAIKIIKSADPEFKITLAGGYHSEIQADLYYLSIPYGHDFPKEVKAERERRGQISTVYTCCSEAFPNIFTFSDPAEATLTPIHAVAGGYDGYLRWAVNSWTARPLQDSRFRLFAAGDTYSIYPGPRSSIRFERFAEGMQDCEKIHLLRKELKAKGDTDALNKLNSVVEKFTQRGLALTKQSAAEMVTELSNLLNSL